MSPLASSGQALSKNQKNQWVIESFDYAQDDRFRLFTSLSRFAIKFFRTCVFNDFWGYITMSENKINVTLNPNSDKPKKMKPRISRINKNKIIIQFKNIGMFSLLIFQLFKRDFITFRLCEQRFPTFWRIDKSIHSEVGKYWNILPKYVMI